MESKNLPLVLIILDGFGIAPPSLANPVSLAKLPYLKYFEKNYPYTLLKASEEAVGLPKGVPGNSEAGHMNLGAGRIVPQAKLIISEAIKDGSFFKNPVLEAASRYTYEKKSNIHLIGLLTDEQSPHADPKHLIALITFFRIKKIKPIYLHLFTDGRDTPPYSAYSILRKLEKILFPEEKIVSLMGRFYAMDRKKAWARTKKAYELLTEGKGFQAHSPQEAILRAYNRKESDEFISPTFIIHDSKKEGLIKDKDVIIFFNVRSDRTRQLTKAFVQSKFVGFKRNKILKDILFVALTDFGPDLPGVLAAYPFTPLKETLPMIFKDKKQVYIAEKEKHAHVTYFFNGGYADPVAGEDRVIIPSPNVKTYDRTPLMAAPEITKKIIEYLTRKRYEIVVANFANPDMIGHTGNIKAAIKALEGIDKCLGKIYNTVNHLHGVLIVTADHGGVEEMIKEKTKECITEHSLNPVPFYLISSKFKKIKLKKRGVLGDVAPTILDILNIPKPNLMTRFSLIKRTF